MRLFRLVHRAHPADRDAPQDAVARGGDRRAVVARRRHGAHGAHGGGERVADGAPEVGGELAGLQQPRLVVTAQQRLHLTAERGIPPAGGPQRGVARGPGRPDGGEECRLHPRVPRRAVGGTGGDRGGGVGGHRT